jgi:hypothetical protein
MIHFIDTKQSPAQRAKRMHLKPHTALTRLVCVLGATLLLSPPALSGWETVLTLDEPGYQFSASGILLDPSDQWTAQRLFVGTSAFPVTGSEALPARFVTIDPATGTYQEAAGLPRSFRMWALGVSRRSSALFAYIGTLWSEHVPGELRRSSDGGVSWSTVDKLSHRDDDIRALAADHEGTLFTVGNIVGQTGIIRKSTDDGQTWSTVDMIAGVRYRSAHFVSGPNGGIFAAGEIGDSGWIVRRSRDSGATWKTVLSTSTADSVQAMTSDAHGNLYVCGGVFGAPIRMSRDGGETWQILRVPSPVGPRFSAAAMLTDTAGNLYVLGGVSVQNGHAISSTVFRRNLEGDWEDLGPNADDTSLGSMALDPAGHLYVGGNYFTARPEKALIVMRLALEPAGLPPLEVASSGGAITVSWLTVEGAQLESTTVLGQERNWQPVPVTPATDAGKSSVRFENDSPNRYFRLSKP